MIIDEMKAGRIDGKTYIDADWLLEQYKQAIYKQALEDVRAGVPERMANEKAEVYAEVYQYELGHDRCRTAVLEHLDLLGKE